MYLFKTSGSTFESVIKNQKHAFKHAPKEWYKGEIILVSKNTKDCKGGEKQIQYTMKLDNIRKVTDNEINDLWPGNEGRWHYIADCVETAVVSTPFNLDEIIGDEAKRYAPIVTFKRVEDSHEEPILKHLNLTERLFPEEAETQNTHTEGATKTITVNAYERDRRARQKCLEKHGYNCFICEFNFESMYGELGKDFIHVHHKIPLSEIRKSYVVDPENDLVPVCPNCHAMLHRKKKTLEPEELKSIIKR